MTCQVVSCHTYFACASIPSKVGSSACVNLGGRLIHRRRGGGRARQHMAARGRAADAQRRPATPCPRLLLEEHGIALARERRPAHSCFRNDSARHHRSSQTCAADKYKATHRFSYSERTSSYLGSRMMGFRSWSKLQDYQPAKARIRSPARDLQCCGN
jgi:hypothetical protein